MLECVKSTAFQSKKSWIFAFFEVLGGERPGRLSLLAFIYAVCGRLETFMHKIEKFVI